MSGTADINIVNAGNIIFGDSATANDDRLVFGSSSDLVIYHDTSPSEDVNIIKSEDNLQLHKLEQINLGLLTIDASQDLIAANVDGAVMIFHSGNRRLETIDASVSVLGNLDITGINTFWCIRNANTAGTTTIGSVFNANDDAPVMQVLILS